MSTQIRPLRIAAGVALAAALIAAPASARSRVGRVAEEAGLGLAAGTCTALYLPGKVLVASTGALVGLAAWGLTGGKSEPALDILESTGRGDWLVTQDHLRGDKRFYVFAPEERGEPDSYADQH
jgi:hypothetical protein